MGKVWQSAYYVMRIGLEEMQPSFPVPHLEMEALSQIFTQLRLDHPKVFYVADFSVGHIWSLSAWNLFPGVSFAGGVPGT